MIRSPGQASGFNSATPACAWRPNPECGKLFISSWLQFGHACLRVETAYRTRRQKSPRLRFNSATPACAWRHSSFGMGRAKESARLQFGHACLRVETAVQRPQLPRLQSASIRPRLLARGDKSCRPIPRRRLPPLQFGHACLRVETRAERGRIRSAQIASIRPRLLARGDGESVRKSGLGSGASIRPRLLARGDDSATPASVLQAVASIRPRLLARGDSLQLLIVAVFVSASIRPRLLARGDGHDGRQRHERWRASIRPRLLARGDCSRPKLNKRRTLSAAFRSGTKYPTQKLDEKTVIDVNPVVKEPCGGERRWGFGWHPTRSRHTIIASPVCVGSSSGRPQVSIAKCERPVIGPKSRTTKRSWLKLSISQSRV